MGLFTMRWRGVELIALLLILATPGASAATPKRVLILDSFGRDVAPFNVVASTFRTTLGRELGEPIDLYEESLELGRFAEPAREAPFVDFLKTRFEGYPLDLVMPVGAPAVKFVAQHREHLFPNTPIVFAAAEPRLVPPEWLRTNTTLVTQRVNLPGMIEDILQMQPDTTRVVVVFGASPLEKFWVEECRREFQPFANRVEFAWLDALSLDEMEKQLATLPPHSFILFVMFTMDATGVPYDNDDALRQMHAVASAPLFAYFASQLGLGGVGGRLYQNTEVGVQAAHAAIRILRGERPEAIPPRIIESVIPAYDWRELQRWGISESRLPVGSQILFRRPGLWEQYWGRIVAVLLLCLAQTGLIISLLINRAHRRRAEAAARDLAGQLINAQEQERSRLARELHDDVTQRLARLAIDAGRAERGDESASPAETLRAVREDLVRLSEDVHALSYRLHPSLLDDLGLAEALKAECERFTRQESIPTEVKLHDLPAAIAADRALCLFRVAQSALRNVVRHARARRVEVTLRGLDGGLQLAVRDDGAGFDPAGQHARHTLGLASMRERVHLMAGEFNIESAPGQGTLILAWVPLRTESP